MRKHVPLNWVQWMSLLTTIALAVVLPIIVIQLDNARRDTENTIGRILCFSEIRTLQNPKLTPLQKRQAIQFYNGALAQINEPACKEAS